LTEGYPRGTVRCGGRRTAQARRGGRGCAGCRCGRAGLASVRYADARVSRGVGCGGGWTADGSLDSGRAGALGGRI